MKKLKLLPLLALLLIFSCTKEPKTIVETITKIDTLFLTQTDTVRIKEYISDSTTTVILSRHAETTGVGSDPNLSTAGQERAAELDRVLHNTAIKAVYSTNFNRTKETAAAIATSNSVTTQIYDANKLSQFADLILNQYHNQVVYVAGHSNTTNVLLNQLIGSNKYGTIPDSEFDNLYIVSVSAKGNASVVHLKYGK